MLSLVFCKINKNPDHMKKQEEMEQKLMTFSSVVANLYPREYCTIQKEKHTGKQINSYIWI